MNNQDQFKSLLIGVGEVFGKEVTQTLAQIYWTALKEFTDDEVSEAFNQAVASLKFFPKPCELREFIQGNAEELAYQAWDQVMADIRRGVGHPTPKFVRKNEDGSLKVEHEKPSVSERVEGLVNHLGGWSNLGMMSYKDLDFKRKEFVQLFGMKAERGAIEYKPPLKLVTRNG